MLTVQLLGPVEVRRDGVAVDLGGPQQRAVIAHLALDAGHVVSVDRLVDRLWGEEPPRAPLGTLQSYVSRLRRALEPDRRQGEAPTVLVSEAPGYVLRVEPEHIDLQRFRALVAGARSASPAAALRDLDAALALWRGPALAGLGPDDTGTAIALRLEEERHAAIELRFDALLALGRANDAVPALQEAVGEAPLRERRWAQLALALYRSSRQAEALRALSAARATLADELGLDPGPELRELEQQILTQDPGLQLGDAPAAAAPVTAEVTPPTAAPPRDELVGRHAEWDALTSALARAGAGRAQLVLVEGEPGIGKSTLIGAVADHARATGWQVTLGRCVEPELAPSLWAWIEIARGMVGDVRPSQERRGTGAQNTRPPVDRRSAWRALAIGDRDSGAMSPVELAGSFVELLDDVGAAPQLIVIDDLHWADAPTLDVLRLIVERLGQRRVLVVAAYRQPELVPDSVLGTNLATVHLAATNPVRIAMRPLAGDEVTELIEQTTGAAPSAELADRVQRRAGGNPLFVCELARLAGDRGLEDVEVPTAIRDVVRNRLSPLPDRAIAELEVAAVLGERVALRIVMAASDREPDDCLDALDAAIVTRILVPEGDAFRFAHALVRDAVLAEVAPLRLARLHARAADAILSVNGDGADDAEPIARHRIASLPLADPLVVAKSVVHAADMARWSGAFDAGDRLAQRALDILGGLPHDERVDALEAEALEAIVSAAHRRPDPAAIPASTQLVLDFADRTGSDAAHALAVFVEHHLSGQAPSLPEVQALAEQARGLAASRSAYAQVMSNYVLAAYTLSRGRLDEAAGHIDASLAAAGATDPNVVPVHLPLAGVPYLGSLVAAARGDATAAREHAYVRVRTWSGRRGDVDPNWQNMLGYHRALIETLLDEPQRVLDHLGREPGVITTGLLSGQPATCDLMIAWARARLGDGGAMDTAWAVMAGFDANPRQEMRPLLRSLLGGACLAVGDARAVEVLTAARDEALAKDDVWWLAETLRLLAEALAAAGDAEQAAAVLAEARQLAESQGAVLVRSRIADTAERLAGSGTRS